MKMNKTLKRTVATGACFCNGSIRVLAGCNQSIGSDDVPRLVVSALTGGACLRTGS